MRRKKPSFCMMNRGNVNALPLAQSLAAALLTKGLGRSDNVGLFLPNSLVLGVIFMALNRIGANVVVIPQRGSAEYIKGVLVQLKCVGLLCYVDKDETKRKALMDAIHDMKKTGLIGGDGESVMKCLVTLGAQVKWEAPNGSRPSVRRAALVPTAKRYELVGEDGAESPV